MSTVSDGLYQYGGMPVTPGVPFPMTGTTFFVDPVNGLDGNDGRSIDSAFQTLYKAHAACTTGKNDCVYLIGNGALSGSAILSAALALTIDSTATTGTLTWSKDATHLIGIGPRSNNSRARIAPLSTTTNAIFGDNLVVVSGSGCQFSGISMSHAFATGGTNQICLTVSGQRNRFDDCQIMGMLDAASAADAGSRSLVVGSAGTGYGENVFTNCQIGADTIARSAANASLEFCGATPRNSFIGCTFPLMNAATAGVLGILGTGNACVDRWNKFDRCAFINCVKSTSATQTCLASFTTAAPGGLLLFKNCDTVGITKIGDTYGLANSYVSNVGGAATGGLDVNPS